MKSEKKNIAEKKIPKNHLYKIFYSPLAQKIINIIYTIIFLVAFSYYYYYHDYFKILLIVSAGSLLILLFYLINKKNLSEINYKPILYQEIKINLFKILLIFILISIIFVNIELLMSAGPNLDYIFKKIFSIEINIFYQITSLLIFALIFVLILWSIGSKIIKLLKLKLTSLEEFIFGFTFGAVPLIFSTFFLAVSSLLYTKYILINLLIWILFSYREIINNFKKILGLKIKLPSSKKLTNFNFYKKLILTILFITTIFLFISAIYPQPVNYDSLHTYYNAPKLSLEQHELAKFPLFPFANIPKNIEMLYLNIMTITSPRFLSHIQLIYFVLTLATIYLFCKKKFDQKIGILATTIFYFSTAFFYLVKGVKVDLSLIFYSSIILYTFFNWLKNPTIKWAIILGSLFGISFGIKYNGILLFISIGSIIIFTILYKIVKKSKVKQYVYQSLLILLFTIIFFSPWLIRNKMEFNNYLYPFKIINDATITTEDRLAEEKIIRASKDDYTKIMLLESRNKTEYLLKFPLKYLKKSQHSSMQSFNPLFMVGILLLLLYKKNYKEKILIGTFLIYFVLWFWKADFRIWYGATIFIILSIVIASAIIKTKFLLKNKIIPLIISTYIIICLVLICNIPTAQLYYISGLISEKEYLNQIPIFVISDKLNNIIKEDEKVLLLWDMRTGFIKNNNKNSLSNGKNGDFFNHLINKDSTEVYDSLKEKNVKYIIYRHKKEEIVKNIPYSSFNLNLQNDKSYQNILKNLDLFYQFKTKYLEEIECFKDVNEIKNTCLYKII